MKTAMLPSPFTELEAPAKERVTMPKNYIMILEGHHPDELGLIPSFIDADDQRSAREQFDENYGWHPIEGFRNRGDSSVLHYQGDPPYHPIAAFTLRDEIIVVYRYSIVAIFDRYGRFEVARME